MSFADPKEQLEIIKKGSEEIISEQELLKKLEKSSKENTSLRIKAGFDPTAPDIHLGHCVLLKKLRDFQDLGHTVVLIIGDFTAMIGDPSGRSDTRPPLTRKQVLVNARTYESQVFKIIDRFKTEIVFNSKWLDDLGAEGMLELSGLENVARMLERDDFENRYKAGKPITIKEFMYPLMQAYDSVSIKSDVELGGTDQKFNLLLGRDLQRHYEQAPQIVLTMPILEGLDGTRKMSKSLNNYIAVEDSPEDMYGKIMSVSDDLMWKYYDLLTSVNEQEINNMKSGHPMESKRKLAALIVQWLYDEDKAKEAKGSFETKFSKREFPEDAKEVSLSRNDISGLIGFILEISDKIKSKSEARRLVQQGGLTINGKKVNDIDADLPDSENLEVKLGKREFVRVKIKN
ncbi:MAG: tyrosine--tRNA ligase [Candidatus Dadabacteria bacterium]|nr:tyrosine--tRNA ligase [Candidatus Dadabacteria bacterium]NIS07270.1 tyrosine--tRNA ligase [Candidatus Dadabacteria bacterium]NIY20927.1 tyrosine--tRNA ligase [Candidatus Dadabacteria bacterium]